MIYDLAQVDESEAKGAKDGYDEGFVEFGGEDQVDEETDNKLITTPNTIDVVPDR